MEVADFIGQFRKDCENLIMEIFPQKVVEMDILFKKISEEILRDVDQEADISCHVPIEDLDNSTEPSFKKRKIESDVNNHSSTLSGTGDFADVSVPCNKFVRSYCEKVKNLLSDLKKHANKVRMWIRFLTPKIEDGNNFGVSIQEHIVGEASQVENIAINSLSSIINYFPQRAKLISKTAKYPHIEDYLQSVKEADNAQIQNLQNAVLMMRDRYASFYDVIMKNIDKIKEPRSANAQSMY